MDAITLLTTRYSASRLTEPAPSGEQLTIIQHAALRAPDHGALRPWRFVMFQGRTALNKLGDIFAEAVLEEDPSTADELVERARQLPLRAPLVIACIAKCQEHSKVPIAEQVQSAACAVMAMQQAAFALGFGGIWRTGAYARYDFVKQSLGLGDDDEIVGYLYLGTPQQDAPSRASLNVDDFFEVFA
jgi:nitroreductase